MRDGTEAYLKERTEKRVTELALPNAAPLLSLCKKQKLFSKLHTVNYEAVCP